MAPLTRLQNLHFVQARALGRLLVKGDVMSKAIGIFLTVMLAGVLGGCSSSGKNSGPKGTVSGKVTVNGKPITFGAIAFYKEGAAFNGPIREGSYSVTGVPAGDVKVTINSLPTPAEGGPSTGVPGEEKVSFPKGPFVAVPARFADPAKTPLTYSVVEGDQEKTFDIR